MREANGDYVTLRPAGRLIRSHDTSVVVANELRMRGLLGFPILLFIRCYHKSVVAPYRERRR